jgi:hypothetical protein
MKIFVAMLLNVFFSFLGFTLFLVSGYNEKPTSFGWIGGGKLFDLEHWIYFSMFLSIFAAIPVGLFNGLILAEVKNNLLTALSLALMLSILLTFLAINASSSFKNLGEITLLFVICSLCNVATVYILKWKFPNSPLT